MKKVLSYVLVLALVLSSFSMAFAGSATELKSLSDVSGNKNEEAIGVNYDLGIVTGNPDGTFQPEKAVTRAEFAAMITRALAIPQSALAGYANTSFKDVAGYTWAVPYLAFCNSKGIMLGDGAGNAMPGKTITVNEAVTMSLRALGYTANSSELTGVWPSNYVTKAQELKMYDDVAKDATGVDKANAAQIIYNSLTVQKVAVNSDGKTEKLWDTAPTTTFNGDPTTMLSAGLNCELHAGVVVGYNSPDVADSLINIANHIGKYGDVYTNDDDEIVAFISDSDQLTGRFVADGSDIVFKTTDEEKDYNVDKAVTFTAISTNNGETFVGASTTSVAAFTASNGLGVASKEYTISVDLSGKTIKHIDSAIDWKVKTATQIDATDIAEIKDDQSLLGEDFVLDDNDEIDYTQFQLVGIKSLSDLKADNIVYVYSNGDGIRRIEVGTQTVEGVVKSFKKTKDDVATKFAIGANTYKNAGEIINNLDGNDNTNVEDKDVSDSIKAYLDARGYVYDFDNSSKANNFAVVEKFSGTGVSDQAKLMLADGAEKTFEFDLDGKVADSITDTAVALPGALTNLIGYGLNSSGEISEVNTNSAFVATKSAANVPTMATLSSINLIKWFDGTTSHSAKIASDVVVFTYDGSGKDGYDVTTIDKVETNEDLMPGGIGITLLFDDGDTPLVKTKVVAMIIDDAAAKGGVASYAVFNDVDKTSNDANDTVWDIVGYQDGKALKTMTDDENGVFSNKVVNPGYDAATETLKAQVYKIKLDAKGLVTSADLITNGAIALKADNDIVVKTGLVVNSVDNKKSIEARAAGNAPGTHGERYALSSNVVIYQVNSDSEYKTYGGSLKPGDCFNLYNFDATDDDAYDVVVFYRP